MILALALLLQDWPRWRGPEGSATSDASPLPLKWTSTDRVLWSTVIPGEGASSPVVRGDLVFVTAAQNRGAGRHVVCLDLRTGAILWTGETADANPERTSALTGHAAPTPVVDASRVLAFFGNAGVVAYDLKGRLLWRRSLGEFDSELGIASSPILHEGLVILVGDHDGDSFLVALEAATGNLRWKQARPGLQRSWSTPVVAAGELVVNAQDELRGYDPASGKHLWSLKGMSGWVAPSPVAGKGLVFATSGKDGPVLAVRPGGKVAWREERGGPYVCSPVLYGDFLYVLDEAGRLTCREAATGAFVYRERLNGKFTASGVAGDGRLYFPNEAGTTVVVKADRAFEVLAENPLGEEILASPAIAGGSILLRTRTRLWRLR